MLVLVRHSLSLTISLQPIALSLLSKHTFFQRFCAYLPFVVLRKWHAMNRSTGIYFLA